MKKVSFPFNSHSNEQLKIIKDIITNLSLEEKQSIKYGNFVKLLDSIQKKCIENKIYILNQGQIEYINNNIADIIILEKKVIDSILEYYNNILTDIKKSIDLSHTNDIYNNINNVCNTLHFNENGDNVMPLKLKEIIEEKDNNKIVPPYITELNNKKDRAMTLLGRTKILDNLTNYNINFFKLLKLSSHPYDWTPSINDLFVSCAYSEAMYYKYDNSDNLFFYIMMVIDNEYMCHSNELFSNYVVDDKLYSDTITNELCVTPYPKDYIHHKNKWPSITFREIILLTDILQMDCYELVNLGVIQPDDNFMKNNKILFFNPKSIDISMKIKKYNNTHPNLQIRLILFNWTSNMHQVYKNKYIKYKMKYKILQSTN